MSLNPDKKVVVPTATDRLLTNEEIMTVVSIGWQNLRFLYQEAQPRLDPVSRAILDGYYYFEQMLKRRGESDPSINRVRLVHGHQDKEYVFNEPIDITPLFNGLGNSVLDTQVRKDHWKTTLGESDPLVKDLAREEGRIETFRKILYLNSEPATYRLSGSQREARLDFEVRNQATVTRKLPHLSNDPFEILAYNQEQAERRLKNMRWLKLPSTM